MTPINVKDRETGQIFVERVFGGAAIELLYGNSLLSRTAGRICQALSARLPFFSSAMGWWYDRPQSRKMITPFIQEYGINISEFLVPSDQFPSFNAFFTRQLKPAARPIAQGEDVAVMPADARYLFYPHMDTADGFIVKGRKFDIHKLIDHPFLAEQFKDGSMLIARLCPSDYHRFHFPVACKAFSAHLVNGYLYSVNPIALRQNVEILSENKRYVTVLNSPVFGEVLYIEIGATSVGSVIQTYDSLIPQEKGAEKGYFSFGASCVIVIFRKNTIKFDADLLEGPPHQEIYCKMGQSLGRSTLAQLGQQT